MTPQEVITIIIDISAADAGNKEAVIKMHPELDQFFDKGMYIEKLVQNSLENGKCAITFVFRHYNNSQSKN
jgi:3'-phosphoadenosine 5'-phosphosulfate sulfotransferase